MVRPSSFGYDEQTAVTNVFQHQAQAARAKILALAQAEFQTYVNALRTVGIEVVIYEDTPIPPKPNGVFPNNWLTTWPDGRAYIYPMATASRRIERNPGVLDLLRQHFRLADVIDLAGPDPAASRPLEGTGVIIFDHLHKIAYACISPRCDEALFKKHAKELGYTPVAFRAYLGGLPVYHANLILGIQTTTAVLCSATIPDPAERRYLIETLESTGRTVLDISEEQAGEYCGNILELKNKKDELYLVLSASAQAAFTSAQLKALGQDKTLLPVAVPTIQRIGGGSVRCMIAEIFLPPR